MTPVVPLISTPAGMLTLKLTLGKLACAIEIEFIVEKTMDKLDSQLMSHKIDLAEYDLEVDKLNVWANLHYQQAA